MSFTLPKHNLKDLDPSYKMDLDFLGCFGSENLHLIPEEIRYCEKDVKSQDGKSSISLLLFSYD